MTTTAAVKINASYSLGWNEGLPQSFDLSVHFDTDADRDAFIALFPKSAKITPTVCHYGEGVVKPIAVHRTGFTANGNNGGVNETGTKRVRNLLKTLDKSGVEVEWTTPFRNSYATRADFEAAIA